MTRLPDWIYRQSAVLPYREGNKGLEVLLISTRKGGRWIVPKGIVEPGLTPRESARKEAAEEAGIEGQVSDRSLGRYSYKKWGGTCDVEVFPMLVARELEDWPEAGVRRRKWMPLKKAAKRIDIAKLSKMVRRLKKPAEAGAEADAQPPARAAESPRVIYLLRHAKSSWDDPAIEDFNRPLAARGRRAAEAMSRYMRIADVKPDLVLCSSAVRAKQTLEDILPALGDPGTVKYDRGIYHGGVVALTNRLRRVPDQAASVMMVGHNPALQALALALAGGGDPAAMARLEAKFATAGLVTLVLNSAHWQDLKPGACDLHSFVLPRELP